MTAEGGSSPVFLVSFDRGEQLASRLRHAGWRVVVAQPGPNVPSRFASSGASIAIVDVRGDGDSDSGGDRGEGLAAIAALAPRVVDQQSVLLALVAPGDAAAIDRCFEAGATHYLAPARNGADAEVLATLRFLRREIERLDHVDRTARQQAAALGAAAETWVWRPGEAEISLNPGLVERLRGQRDRRRIADLLALLDGDGRRAALAAIRRVRARAFAAFAHAAPGGGADRQVVHHLRREADGTIVGQIEHVGADGSGHDALTRLDDIDVARRWIQDALAANRPAPRVFVLLVSLSRFGMMNAAFGRVTGDVLLQGVARRLDRIANDGGPHHRLVARLPGAQFLIALAGGATAEEATLLADQIVEAMARPFLSQEHVISLSCRIGIADDASGDRSFDSLLRRATIALDAVRDGEGGSARVIRASGEQESELRSRLEIDLRQALDEDRIEILFQPQVAIASGAITGVEALARWRHPRLGELGAITLFAAAERSDYLQELSAHVQRKALVIAASWPPELSALRLSINVTAADMVRASFAAQFLEMVDLAGIERHRVTVELTESGLIEDLGMAADLLAQLRGAGLRAAIDDFGTGYSSLAYLKALPFDYLKIDKRFAQDIGGAARDRIVVRSVIDLARSLGLSVVAEGVETEEQLALLASAGCNFYQGFLCAPPLDSRALHAVVMGASRRPLVG